MLRKTLPLLLVLIGCAANRTSTGELELEEERDASSSQRDSGRRDASTRSDASVRRDASIEGCEGDTPHGCYTLTDDSPEGCPEQAPEIPLGLPFITDWDLCSNLAVSAGQTCIWEGPEGGTASCLCDTGVHWLCVYL